MSFVIVLVGGGGSFDVVVGEWFGMVVEVRKGRVYDGCILEIGC